MWAIHRGHHECAQMLLDRGAVIEDQNKVSPSGQVL